MAGYLVGAVGTAALLGAPQADAAVVVLDVSAFDGINSGLPPGVGGSFTLLGGDMYIYNGNYLQWGLVADWFGGGFAVSSLSYASPKKFLLGNTVDASALFTGRASDTVFKYVSSAQTAWDSGSYLGFLSTGGNYGWINVTWDPAINTFNVISGAYESVTGQGITISASAVPEPSRALLALAGLGGIALRRRRKLAA
jgi:MYXO-CTERM domain-containing protein